MLNSITANKYSNFNSFQKLNYNNNDKVLSFKASVDNQNQQHKIFIAMPMPKDKPKEMKIWNEIKDRIISIAAGKNAKAQRIDDILTKNPQTGAYHSVSRSILKGIDESDILIADISERNPNVYFELGYALGRDKEIVQIAKQGTELPFDVKGRNTVFYRNRKSDLAKNLSVFLDSIIEIVEKKKAKNIAEQTNI